MKTPGLYCAKREEAQALLDWAYERGYKHGSDPSSDDVMQYFRDSSGLTLSLDKRNMRILGWMCPPSQNVRTRLFMVNSLTHLKLLCGP